MNYAEYLFSQLLSVYDDGFKNAPYDEQFHNAMRLYQDFMSSNYNKTSKSEYDCMCDYLSADQHKKVQLGDKIVESLNQFYDIDPEVWKYVSKKMGYTIQEKAETPLLDAKDFNYTRELEHRLDMVQDDTAKLRSLITGIDFPDSDHRTFAFNFINNIDIACDLGDRESLGWNRYK
jgi:hypothetical protein